MAKIYVKIKGIHCQNCETTIQKALLKLPRVKEVTIKNFIAHITYEEPLTNDEIINAITKAGYITKPAYIRTNLKELEKSRLKPIIFNTYYHNLNYLSNLQNIWV